MKFTCDKNLFNSAINDAIKAVAQKSSLAALDGILISTDTNSIKLTGFDLNIGIESIFEADVIENGSIVVKANMLSEIIKCLPNDTVCFESDDRNTVTVTCGPTKIDVLGIHGDEFPQLFYVEDSTQVIEIKQAAFKSMIRQTLYAAATGEAKPNLVGSKFEVRANKLRAVSLDGIRIALREETLENELQDNNFVVPAKTLNELLKLLDDNDEMLYIKAGEKHVMFEVGNLVVVSRLLSNDFFEYTRAFPASHTIEAIVDTKAFSESIERVSIVINEKLKAPICCNFDEEIIKMYSKTATGYSYDEVIASVEGGKVEIGFNNRFMLEALRAAECEKIKIQLSSPLAPIIIKPADEKDNNFTFLILPVKLKANDQY
ncbi:MAG: DNA polymerase III subunit beta [Ruminococcaceae bacterium]|nr:DNA polymerase III subunit beta [Oscillospiraceae bacterium]